MFAEALALFAVAVLLALLEIEIEGKYGWSEKIPTWYRTTGFAARVWGLLMGGKPLTGYHLFLGSLILMMFHLKFFQEVEWSLEAELMTMASFQVMAVFWDFLWFVFNPHYTVNRFKSENIWWFSKSHWAWNLFPLDYLMGLVCSVLLACLSGMVDNSTDPVIHQLVRIGSLLTLTFIAIVLSPLYRRWYSAMRKKDDRDKAGIFHVD